MSKRILMVVTGHGAINDRKSTGVWFEEFAIPFQLFHEAGFHVEVASIEGGSVPIDETSMPQDLKEKNTARAMEALDHTTALTILDLAQFDAVFFPGGHGTMFDFPKSIYVSDLVSEFMAQGKPVAAVCHGPAALVNAKDANGQPVVKGREVAAFTNKEEAEVQLDGLMPFLLETRLRELGAEVKTAPNWQDNIVIDGNLITGQNPQSSASAATALINALS